MIIFARDNSADIPSGNYKEQGYWELALPHNLLLQPYEQKTVKLGIYFKFSEGISASFIPRASVNRSGILIYPTCIGPNEPEELGVQAINLTDEIVQLPKGRKLVRMIVHNGEPVLQEILLREYTKKYISFSAYYLSRGKTY